MGSIMRVRAADKGDDANSEESENALETTIEKSKKVLTMQKDLLQQVFFQEKPNSVVLYPSILFALFNTLIEWLQ